MRGRARGLRARDLDITAVDFVAPHARGVDAARRFFGCFESDKRFRGIRGARAQFVQARIKAVRDNAAFAGGRRRRGGDGALQKRARLSQNRIGGEIENGGEFVRQLASRRVAAKKFRQCRQGAQRIAQRREVARARDAQRDASGDSFEVGDFFEQRLRFGEIVRGEERFD